MIEPQVHDETSTSKQVPRWLVPTAAGTALALAGGVLGGLIVHWSTPEPVAAPVVACDTVALADQVLPSVVTINVTGQSGRSNGTGEIVRADGYILTNDHVIAAGANGGSLSVLFSSGESLPATVVGRVVALDLAVVKVDSPDELPTIELAPASPVVGQPVVALGSPLGLEGSVTRGIVSALGREVRVPADGGGTALVTGAVQTDASINPGNSGGPLIDCDGRMVGVNTAIATVPNSAGQSGGGSVGIGFAIPVDLASAVADELIETGEFALPSFGVDAAPITQAIAERYGLRAGLYVRSVTEGGPAAAAGITAGDVIVEVDGRVATTIDALTHATLDREVGDVVPVTYLRGGVPTAVEVTLG